MADDARLLVHCERQCYSGTAGRVEERETGTERVRCDGVRRVLHGGDRLERVEGDHHGAV